MTADRLRIPAEPPPHVHYKSAFLRINSAGFGGTTRKHASALAAERGFS